MSGPPAPANRILVWVCVLIAINQLGFGSIVPVMALYARSFGVLQSATGVAIGVYGLARFLVAVPAWQLADRCSRHTTLAVGGLVSAAGNLLCAHAPTFMAFVGALRGRSGSRPGAHRRSDRPPRHHDAGPTRANDGHLAGRLPVRRGCGPALLFARYAPETYSRGKF